MAQQELNRPQIDPALQQVRGEGVPQGAAAGALE
jgi:hypothetical protein